MRPAVEMHELIPVLEQKLLDDGIGAVGVALDHDRRTRASQYAPHASQYPVLEPFDVDLDDVHPLLVSERLVQPDAHGLLDPSSQTSKSPGVERRGHRVLTVWDMQADRPNLVTDRLDSQFAAIRPAVALEVGAQCRRVRRHGLEGDDPKPRPSGKGGERIEAGVCTDVDDQPGRPGCRAKGGDAGALRGAQPSPEQFAPEWVLGHDCIPEDPTTG